MDREKYLKRKKRGFKAVKSPDTLEYEKKLRRHKLKVMMIILSIIAVVFVIVGINILKEKTKVYGDYDVETAMEDKGGVKNTFFKFQNGIIEISKDGISYIEGKQTIWNYAYEIKNPIYATCKNYIAVGDSLGTKVYVFSNTGYQNDIDVLGNPTGIEVTESGCVVVSIEENTTNYIYMYSQDTQIYKIKTDIAGGGYPLAMATSDDGQKLVVSYLYIDGEKMMTKVVFYNFSGVGQNETERAVGAWHYEDSVIPKVEFLDNDTVALVGDNLIEVYNYKQIPQKKYEVSIDKEIQQIFIDEGYIGIVSNVTDSSNSKELQLYAKNGPTPVLEYLYNVDYTEYMIANDYVMMYNSSNCKMINFNNTVKFDYTFSGLINKMIKTNTHSEFYILTEGYIQKIRLK